MPSHDNATTLRAVFTFYSDIMTLTSEGDSVLNDETMQSIGTKKSSFTQALQALFGSILSLASPPDLRQTHTPGISAAVSSPTDSLLSSSSSLENQTQQAATVAVPQQALRAGISSDDADMEAVDSRKCAVNATTKSLRGAFSDSANGPTTPFRPNDEGSEIETGLSDEAKGKKLSLIKRLPLLGYFVAGAVAGGVSRTFTAPLDRMKVYLLVNTKNTNAAIDAAKKGRPLLAITNACRSFWAAGRELKAAGGYRGFFAGMLSQHSLVA
jgi:solute carrier family 25 phosphate transporter 23/24/25/41